MTWITGKELEREINNNGDQFRRKKKDENYIAAVRVCCTCKVVFSLIRNKSVLHVQIFFLLKERNRGRAVGTLRPDNGDVHENVAEKLTSHPFTFFLLKRRELGSS